MIRYLTLLPVGELGPDRALLDWLGHALERELGLPARPGEPLPLREEWREETGQFSSNRIVDALVDRAIPGGEPLPSHWTLALTRVDLCAPERSFVFGEATLGGCWALVSLARLRPPAEEPDPERLRARLLTEAVHELGHLAGLDHCPDAACVMFSSRALEESDAKGAGFCGRCRPRFAERLRGA